MSNQPKKSSRKLAYKSARNLAVIIGISISFFVGWFIDQYYKEKERLQFETLSSEITILVKNRMAAYEQVLKSGVGLFNASDSVTRKEWNLFVKEQKLNQNFKGIQGLGYSEIVLPQNRQNYEQKIRKEGFPNFKIKPDGRRKLYTSITYLEPFDDRNQRAFGYDMFSEKTRREAMTKAMQSGEAALSGKITLLQEYDTDIQAGFLMYLPVYKKMAKLNSQEDRVAAIEGFVYAPFRANDLMQGILGSMFSSIDFEIYDGSTVNEKNIIYDYTPKHKNSIPEKREHIVINKHAWTLVFRATGTSEYSNSFIPFFALGFLLLLTLLLYLLLNSLLKTQETATQIAKKATAKLHDSEERLRFAIEGNGDGLWDWNLKSNEVYFSKRWKEMLGFKEDEIPYTLEAWESRVHPQDIECVYEDITTHIKGESEAYSNEHRMKCKDGSYKWILARGIIVERDEQGTPVRMIGTHTDIDKTKKLQDELVNKNNELETLNQNLITTTKLYENEKYKYKHILDLASDGIFLIDTKGNLLEYSNKAMELLGYNPQEMKTLSVYDWDKEISKEDYKDIIATLQKSDIELERIHTRKDGSTYLAQITASLITFDGQLHAYSSVRDITEKRALEQEIIHERNFISTIIDTANAIIAVIQPDGTMSLLNRYGEKFTGCSQEEVASEPYFWKRFLNKDTQKNVIEIIAKANEGEIVRQYQNSWISHSGEERMFEWSNQIIFNDDGSLNYIFTIGIDIEQKVQAQQQVLNQKNELEAIFNTALEGISILDLDTKYLYVNNKYLGLIGYTQEELQSKHCYELTSAEYLGKSQEIFQKVLKDGYYENFERTCITKNGEEKRLNSSIALMHDKKRFLMSTVDHTELHNAMQLIKRQAYIDELTQLNNRKSYNRRIDELITEYQRYGNGFSVLMFDIDFFKSINDTYGHQKGDEVLIELSKIVRSITRANDYAFRIGGEEFIVLLTHTNLENAIKFAEKLRSTIESKLNILEDTKVTVSVGVTEIKEDDTENSVFKRVDVYLYHAKESGRNKVVSKDT